MTNSDWEGEIKSAGDTVRITTPDFSSIQIGEGVVPDTSDVYPKQITLTIDKSRNFQFKFNDIEQAQSQFNMLEGYMSGGLQKMMDKVNLELEEAVIADTNVPTVGTSASYFDTSDGEKTVQFFNRIKRKLVENKALNSAGFYNFKGSKEQALALEAMVTITPAMFEQLVSSNVLTHPTVQGDDVIYKGVAGQIAGMKIFVDTNLMKVSGYDETNEKNIVIAGTKMGITFAEQFNKVEKLRDPQSFADIGRALYLYGYKITNPKCLVVGYSEA